MRILLDGYFDRNLGDDLMLTLAADGLKEHELYVPSYKIKIDNVRYTTAKSGFDAYLKVIGSGFQIYNALGIACRLRDMYRENKYAPIKAVINCNISKFKNNACEAVIKKHLSQFDFITVRDKFSYGYLRRNLKQPNKEVYPDMVFSLPDSMIPDTPCENFLGIAAHNSMDCKSIARIADSYIEETGNKALLLCFDTGIENDKKAAENVSNCSKHKDKLEIVLYENIPDMLAQMKRCSVILGARLHSIVLAARMGIPFVPLSYSDKTINALREINYNGTIYPANAFNADKVRGEILTPARFELDKQIITDAQNHILKFNEFLKQQA